jgi:glycerate dehydrogenase
MSEWKWHVVNPGGSRRVLVTKGLPGERWLQLLQAADCRVEIALGDDVLPTDEIRTAMGEHVDAVIGQLPETWSASLLEALKQAGGSAYCNYAVGYDNVDVGAATRLRLPVGNTPGVLTETTAELAVALALAAARRIPEGDRFMRAGRYHGWLPQLLLGDLLYGCTVGVIGAGRIGTAFARMMMEGHRTDIVYHDPRANAELEAYSTDYGGFLAAHGESPVSCRRTTSLDELLRVADVVSVHAVLDESTRHLIGFAQLALMKETAILVNASRGPLVDEAALVAHCRAHPHFRAALDVYEAEPAMAPGLAELDNVVVAPHVGSASRWTREGMATLAAANVAGMLRGFPVWPRADTLKDVLPFLEGDPPHATPSIVNAASLGLTTCTPDDDPTCRTREGGRAVGQETQA